MMSRGLLLLLWSMASVVVALLWEGGQADAYYYYVPTPRLAPAPAGSPATANSSAAPPPVQPTTTFPTYGVTPGSLQPQECGGRCAARCSATAYRKPCLFFCSKCCAACLCVPAGTYGNKASCPCYDNWKTKRGGPKCP
ncbi:unnamed protein product [Urochloa humidicola]